jgi:hypothetical protein
MSVLYVWLGFAASWVIYAVLRLDWEKPFWPHADEVIILGGCAVEFAVWALFGVSPSGATAEGP